MNRNLILIADDDPDIRDIFAVTLESAGYRTVCAKDGNTTARILTVARPVALITDVRMPALNGMELCQLARRTPARRDTTILMISSSGHAYDVDAGLAAGADRYLPKSLPPRRLADELQQLIADRFRYEPLTPQAARS